MSLAGSASAVQILLRHGANPNAAVNNGMTPHQLAQVFGWKQVIAILIAAGAQ
jgi:ankyrin repeat protein